MCGSFFAISPKPEQAEMKSEQTPQLLNKDAIGRTLTRIAHEIAERNSNIKDVAIVGIRNRGEHLAKRIYSIIKKNTNEEPQLGILDITLYRDDLTDLAQQPIIHETSIDFDISAKHIVLVDDVLYTGRTIRCALDELIDFGRPKSIQLAVLVDRGHRELPIRADYVGKNVPTAEGERVEVHLEESDGVDEVVILK